MATIAVVVLFSPRLPMGISSLTLPRPKLFDNNRVYLDQEQPSSRGVRPLPALAKPDMLQPGQFVQTAGAEYPQLQPVTYKVKDGDTLLSLSEQFHLDVKTIVWANDALAKQPDRLTAGQELVILPLDAAYHTVAAGETLESIAAQYHVTPRAITAYKGNDIPASGQLTPGMKLIIPGAVLPEPKAPEPTPEPALASPADMSAPPGPQHGSGQFLWPAPGPITQYFGPTYLEAFHRGIDIGCDVGTPVHAADSGTVVLVAWWQYSYGYHIVIDHGGGLQTLYGHLSEIDVEAGQAVAKGQVIGKSGSTGFSTGPHLHFEVDVNGQPVNPLGYLP
jgi:murein DD-endopeptidase MepM/ murein hydrolase activator NlpD